MRLLKSSILALLLIFSATTQAARFEVIGSEKLVNKSLRELAQFWTQGPGQHTDVYAQAASILKKRETEPYEHTLMQMLWGNYTFQVSAEAAVLERMVVKKEIDFLFDAATWLQSEAEPAQVKAYKKELLSRLMKFAALEQIQFYVGVVEGDFSASFVHLSLIDLENQQTLSLLGGYAE